MWMEAPVKRQRTSVGLDVHTRSVVGCGLDGDTGEVFQRRLTPDYGEILDWLRSLPGMVAVTYEAARPVSGWAGSCWPPGCCVWSLRRRSCRDRPGIGSRPMPAMPLHWPGCCIWGRSPGRCPQCRAGSHP